MLRSSDVICVLKDSRIAEIKAALRRIQMLFHDDPLFHLEHDGRSRVLHHLQPQRVPAAVPGPGRVAAERAGRQAGCAGDARRAGAGAAGRAAPLDLGRYAAIVNTVATVDLARFVRHQPACLITEDRTIVPVFEEVYTSIPDLERALGGHARSPPIAGCSST